MSGVPVCCCAALLRCAVFVGTKQFTYLPRTHVLRCCPHMMEAGVLCRPPEGFPICGVKGEEDTDSINSSSSDSTDGHGSSSALDKEEVPLRSFEHINNNSSRRTWQWSLLVPSSPRVCRRGTAVAVAAIALICAITAAIGANLCGGCFGGLCWAGGDDGAGSGCRRRGGVKLKMGDDGAALQVRIKQE